MSPFMNLNFLLKCFNFPKPSRVIIKNNYIIIIFYKVYILDPMKPVPPVTR